MSFPRLAARLYNTPLLITLEKAEVIEHVFRAHIEGTAATLPEFKAPDRDPDLAAIGGAIRAQGGYMRTSDGVALIQVVGSLVQRGGGMDAASGLESYDAIGSKLENAMADPNVRGILLEIDSSGGESAGLFDLAARVRAMDGTKPITAHANEQAFSAAYGLGAAAGELYVAKTGMVGSIGVIMMHVDQSAYDAKRGLTYTPITYGSRKADFNPHAPLSDDALSAAQAMVDKLGETFVAHVAWMRGVEPDDVRKTNARVMHPDEALSLKLVDGTGTLADAVASLRDRMNKRPSYSGFTRAAGAQPQEHTMPDVTKPAATAATAEQLAAERAAGLAEGQAATTKAAADAAAASQQAERDRVAGILGHAEAAGREGLAKHLAFKTNSTVDDAAALLAASAKETAAVANPLAAAMNQVPNPKVGADVEATKETAPSTINTANVYAFRKECVAKVRGR
jgi:signal peptide peptidase SppA